MLQGSVVVVVVVGHGPQSCGHVEQSSGGPHNPSPHTQLQGGGDPPVQLQGPALQSAMTCLRHAPLACPLKPLAATSSLQARLTARRERSGYRRLYGGAERQHREANEHLASGHGRTSCVEAARVPPPAPAQLPSRATQRRALDNRGSRRASAAVKRRLLGSVAT